ncbi:MAG: alpha/beta hydrolase-fold protein [Clostridia bacterium]|nr:alpha/beta hydrolase-fold protein [Clostridia bacterium]
MIEKITTAIPQLSGKRYKRRIYIYVPDSFQEDDTLRYPVLYMFDGHNVFFDEDATYGKSWGMKDYLDYTQAQVMVVGVECNHRPPHKRLDEYAPFSFADSKFGKVTGKGKVTMDWMTGSLKEFIDENYPSLPDRDNTFLCGSSMGGLMTVYGVIAYNYIFSRGAALSPSLWTAPEKISQMIRKSELDENTVLYMDYGENEFRNHPQMKQTFLSINQVLLEKDVLMTTRIVPGGEHCEACWEKQLPIVMNTLLYDGNIEQ